jgi:RimJ/RimL family protein N-acetyltransferase
MPFFSSYEALKHMIIPDDPKSFGEDWIKRQRWRYKETGLGLMALKRLEDNKLVGMCGLIKQTVDGTEELEVGYHLIPEYWCKGYASEAAIAAKNYGFSKGLAESIISIIVVTNEPSIKVAGRNGMTPSKRTSYKGFDVHIFRVYKQNHQTFETERLILRPTSIDDASFILELMNTPKWLKYIGDRKVKTEQDAINYIDNKMLPQLIKLGYGNYTAIRKSDYAKVGTCGLYDREGLEGIDIGFAFLPQYEKMGYAFESANKVKEAALQLFNVTHLKGITLEENISSQKLLGKLGFIYTGDVQLPKDKEKLMLFEFHK